MKHVAMVLLWCVGGWAEMPTIPVARTRAEGTLDPSSPEWKNTPAASLSLQRTPPLYPTDQPASFEISSVRIQLLKGQGQLFVRLEWADKTRNAASLPEAQRAWQGEHLVAQSESTDRFSDACAVMAPANPNAADVSPSLQMGDAAHPAQIFFWDATRGAAVMEAKGRETTHRTGKTFPAQSLWAEGKWTVTLQLPELPTGTPLAVAIWNGDQQDRDGRKYFSVWYKMQ